MASTQFELVTDWAFEAPITEVWREIAQPEHWPSWWRAVKRVEVLQAGGADGVGAIRRFTWRTALPYDLTFDMRATRVVEPHLLEGRASGELDGTGLWTLATDGSLTRVRYRWTVEVTKPWMRLFAPLLRPVFAWNHGVVMRWGFDGLQRRLAARS